MYSGRGNSGGGLAKDSLHSPEAKDSRCQPEPRIVAQDNTSISRVTWALCRHKSARHAETNVAYRRLGANLETRCRLTARIPSLE